jgi:hypothetical protein
MQDIRMDIWDIDDLSEEVITATNRTIDMHISEYIIIRYIFKVGKPPERTLNSDVFHGRNINTRGPEMIDIKHNTVHISAC